MRVISLVPSLTLTLAELGLDASQLVGRTPWCIHPESFVEGVKVMGGTKTPNINKLRNARPDLVILDREENPKEVYEALNEAGIETFVSEVEHVVSMSLTSIQMGMAIQWYLQNKSLNTMSKAYFSQANRMNSPSKKVKPFVMLWKHLVARDRGRDASMVKH